MKKPARFSTNLVVPLIAICAIASFAQSSTGFRYNNLNVSPYVNVEYMYDSNVDFDKRDYGDNIYTVNPGVDISYTGNNWGLQGNAWYGYDWYNKYDQLDQSRYGESLKFYAESERGLRLVLGQNFMRTHQDDSLLDGGRGIWRDRTLHEIMGALSYTMSERTAITWSGLYSDLDYENKSGKYAQLYGWREWHTGLELARRLTAKSNVLLSGSYQEYDSKGAQGISSTSRGYTLMGGFGSRATERISYRALTGMSYFDYAKDDGIYGWVYSLDGSWILSRKWAWSVGGSSYFQPSEREVNQATQVYTLSSGLTYRPVKRLTTSFDIGWRHENKEYKSTVGRSRDLDKVATRLRADYKLQKYVSIYGSLGYEKEFNSNRSDRFDRFRGVVGLHFRY